MEELASGNGELLLLKMRALARRGALLFRQPDGTGLIEQAGNSRQCETLSHQEFVKLLEAGWLRNEAGERFVFSRRGATALRNMLSRTSGQRAQLPSNSEGGRMTGHPERRSSKVRTSGRPRGARPRINLRESPLAWLSQHRDKSGKPLISAIELDAGERLRADFERAHMGQRVTASWEVSALPSRQVRGAPGAGLELSESVVWARQRVERALAAVGPELAGILMDVCCFLKGIEQAERNGGWPRRAGKVVLQLALAQLARHYGFDRHGDTGKNRSRIWHANGWDPRGGGGHDSGNGAGGAPAASPG